MASCCEGAVEQIVPTQAGMLTIALAGNPNSGKTTIFNALTGLRQKVANYPGVTVERKTGRCKLPDGRWGLVIDVPGTYSLISRSPDELVAMQVLRGLRADTPVPDLVLVVVDASNLQRNLYLVSQLIELGRPLVVALNMMDVATRRGLHVSAEKLQAELGVPVVPVVGHKRQGIAELKQAIAQARVAPMPAWPLPEAMKEELVVVGGGLAIMESREEGKVPLPQSQIPTDMRRLERYQALAERLLIGDHADDLGVLAGREPVRSLLTSAAQRMNTLGVDPMQADIEAHYRWIEHVADEATASVEELAAMGNAPGPGVLDYAPKPTLSERVDHYAVHKVWGLLIFAAVMGLLFFTIFSAAAPVMDAMKNAVGWLGEVVTGHMSEGPLKALVGQGIFAGVGAVVVFVPQIALLFLFLAILEDSGYLARAAFLMDRILAKVGLHGKSFIPLLSSFACAIPGILATRTIENRKDRLATILVAPFMSCSARLPVYALLIGAFFATYSALAQAGIMFALYALGIIAAATIAWIFKRTLLKGPTAAFILEMPSYKVPQASQVARTVWVNTKEFLTKAGTIIFCMSVVVWAMTYYPRLPEARVDQLKVTMRPEARAEAWTKHRLHFSSGSGPALFLFSTWPPTAEEMANYRRWGETLPLTPEQEKEADGLLEHKLGGERLRHSIAGRIGRVIEPAIRPVGFDWKMGVGLVGAFAAREVFVSTMGIIYSVGDVEEGTTDLAAAMRGDRYADGRPVWTPLVAVTLLIWFVLAMQCMSTIAVVRRETGGWRWPVFMLVYMNALAYGVCLVVYQVGRFWLA